MMVPVQWRVANHELQPLYLRRSHRHYMYICYGHALNLAVQEPVKTSHIL